MAKLRVAVLISGRGSNMRALLKAEEDPTWPARIVRVISNESRAEGLIHARAAGVRTAEIDHRDHQDRHSFEDALHEELASADAELVCLAGFMRLLTERFVDRWKGRLINVHPSLLPSYKGLRTHERVLADGVRITGCTVHFVTAAMDSGPVVVQAAVPVRNGDDRETLAARVLEAEHVCYPFAVRLVAQGLTPLGGGVRREGGSGANGMLISPEIQHVDV